MSYSLSNYAKYNEPKKWFGYLPDEETVKQQLVSEIDTYNDYLNGSWYEYYIEGENGETLDSCGGFYQNKGFSEPLEYMKEYADKDHHPLFDKLTALLDKRACM